MERDSEYQILYQASPCFLHGSRGRVHIGRWKSITYTLNTLILAKVGIYCFDTRMKLLFLHLFLHSWIEEKLSSAYYNVVLVSVGYSNKPVKKAKQ